MQASIHSDGGDEQPSDPGTITMATPVKANPYQAPIRVDEEGDAGALRRDDEHTLTRRQANRVLLGVQVAYSGALVVGLFGLLPTLAAAFAIGSLVAAARSLGVIGVVAAPTVGLLILFAGMHVSNAVRGRQQSLCWLSTVLFFLGGFGSLVSLVRLLDSGVLNGFQSLFAASTFAALLTSLALISLYFRVWSQRCRSSFSSMSFDGSVLFYAIAGVAVSFAVMWPTTNRSMMSTIIAVGIGLLFPALVSLVSGLYRLRLDWRNAMRQGLADPISAVRAVETTTAPVKERVIG